MQLKMFQLVMLNTMSQLLVVTNVRDVNISEALAVIIRALLLKEAPF